MARTIQPGNSKPLGSAAPNSSSSREESIIDKTRTLAFPSAPILNLENFGQTGTRNSVEAMCEESGKDLQESYRTQFSESAKYTDKVNDR